MWSLYCISDLIQIRKVCQQICYGKDDTRESNSDPDVTSGKVKSAFVLPWKGIGGPCVHSCPDILGQPGQSVDAGLSGLQPWNVSPSSGYSAFFWEVNPHLFLWMFYVVGRPERCALIVNVPLTSPKIFLTFAVVPSMAKDMCCHALIEIPHLGNSGDVGLSSFSGHSGISSVDFAGLLVASHNTANLIIFSMHSSHMILLQFQRSCFCLFRLTLGISCHPLPWSRPPSLLPGGPQRKVWRLTA